MGTTEGSVPVQRWRLSLRRAAGMATQREHEAAWELALDASGLPCVRGSGGRRGPRITFAVPLPVGVAGEAEPAELLLAERRRSIEVREALAAVLPAGTSLRDLHDVWLGEPGLPSLVLAADYRIELASDGVDAVTLSAAIADLLGAASLPRVRGADRHYDLRPLIASLALGDDAILRCRLRHDPVLGTGRPDELVLAVGERLVTPPPVRLIVRERVVLAGEG